MSADHAVVDGAPLARFVQHPKEVIEGGYGLEDATMATADVVGAPAATSEVAAWGIAAGTEL